MSTTKQQFDTLLDKMVQERTLSLEALPQIQNLKEIAEAAQKQIDLLQRQLSEGAVRYNNEVETSSKIITALRDELDALKAREKDVAKREAAQHQVELSAAVATAKADAYKDAIHTVFAPNAVRETVFRNHTSNSGTCQNPNGYNGGTNESVTHSENSTVTTERIEASDPKKS